MQWRVVLALLYRTYVHAHCPCQNCNGKAVARSTEIQHQKETKLISNFSTHAQVEDTINDRIEGTSKSNMGDTNENDMEGINSGMDLDGINDNDIGSTITESQPSIDLSNSAEFQTNVTVNPSTDLQMQKNVLIAVLRTFELMEEANASQKSFMNILHFGRDMYCKGNQNMIRAWPSSWSGYLVLLKNNGYKVLLKNNGYKEPVAYYICLNTMHPNQWTILDNSADLCKFCNQPGTIQYHYISLANQIHQWCGKKSFCQQMTAHWRQKDHWLHQNSEDTHTFNEIWDGQRFRELQWFWNPQEKWLLRVRYPHCTEVISADFIKSIVSGRE